MGIKFGFEYLYGFIGCHSNLDSKKFLKILTQNYLRASSLLRIILLEDFQATLNTPLALCSKSQLTFATGYDRRTIHSVNSPPSSGKTTLLKDVFAELIVKQAYALANLTKYTIKIDLII